MTEIFAVANQKGGVGKTTTAINLSSAFAVMGKKVLIIDLDPQGNASTGFGIEVSDRVKTSYDLLIESINPKDCIMQTYINGLSIIPSKIDLAAAEIELVYTNNRETLLKRNIELIKKDYDLIFIDCPPAIGCLTVNALSAADNVLIPMQCEFFALEGLAYLMHSIELIKASLNPRLTVKGIILTMVDKRNKLTNQVELDVRQTFDKLVYSTTIPRNIKLSEAPSHGQPAIIYDSKCLGSMAYIMLVKEMMMQNMEFESNGKLSA
jgi:chromosome partitioning protein